METTLPRTGKVLAVGESSVLWGQTEGTFSKKRKEEKQEKKRLVKSG